MDKTKKKNGPSVLLVSFRARTVRASRWNAAATDMSTALNPVMNSTVVSF